MLMIYLSTIETPEERSLFEQLYYTYRKQMFFVAKGILNDEILAEDALQEAFLGIAKQIALFRDMPDSKVKAYVLTAAKNAAINVSKQEERFQKHQAVFNDVTLGLNQDPVLNEKMYKETYQTLQSVISTLPDFQRDILMLRYSLDMNCSQIANALGRNASTVRKELFRARKALQKACEKEEIEIED